MLFARSAGSVTMTDSLLTTPLTGWHDAHSGRLVDFAGWSMPVLYTSIVEEHSATRTAIGLFDISHMGRLEFHGPDCLSWLDSIVTRRVRRMGVGAIRYALVTNERGGILDDVLVYHLPDPSGSARIMMVVNASNREKIVDWLSDHRPASGEVEIVDLTRSTAMIAVQGPQAVALADPFLEVDLPGMKYYTGTTTRFGQWKVIVSRTGYTGEDGCELIVPTEAAEPIWQQLLDAGQDRGAVPVGLGARDTLRLEAAMPLYGHELSEQINPIQAGLRFAVQMKDHEFIGRAALARAVEATDLPQRVGLRIEGRRPAREHYPVVAHGRTVGELTSGTFSPTLGYPIAMAYVPADLAKTGTSLEVDIRGKLCPAHIVPLPFYSRPS